jgi:hypothetical protein
VKCYYSFPFKMKIGSLALAILFTWTLHRRVVNAKEGRIGPLQARLVALVSLVLWGVVAWGGRWIGFSG